MCRIFLLKTEAARCRLHGLSSGIKILGSCRGRPGEMCQAKCEQKRTTIWQIHIQCVNGRWSPTPACQGASVVKSLEMVNCDQLPVEVRGKTFCLKITQKISRKSMCPDLVPMRLNVRNCSRYPGSDCKVSCGIESTTLKCLPNGKWSHIPKCGTLKQMICPVPKVGKLLNCTRREGEKCKVVCPGGKVINRFVLCLPSGEWSVHDSKNVRKKRIPGLYRNRAPDILSLCSCALPTLPDEMITPEDCSQKKPGEKCHLECKKHFAIIGHSFIECQSDLSWTALPECSDKTCPLPQLKEPLMFAEDCAAKLSGEKCELQCNGFARIVQTSPFKCINATHWSQYPHCVCYSPVLPDDMSTTEDCERKNVGMTCKLKCKGNLAILGSNFITCQNNGSWTSVPNCKRNTCTKPHLSRLTIIPTEDCSSKRVGETCNLQCVKVPETYQIVCLNSSHWSEYPKCSCPTPSFLKYVDLVADCSEKKPGEKCRVACKDTPLSDKHLYISCKNNNEWSAEPPCDKIVCPNPTLPTHLLFNDDCSQKGKGDTCNVICKTGGTTVDRNYIKCINGLHWSDFPTCTCPKPFIPDNIEALEDCSFKRPNDTCRVKCREDIAGSNKNFLSCLNNATWTVPPSCLKVHCPNPDSPSHLKVRAQCSGKLVGGTCEVLCKEGGNTIGSNVITCLRTLKWSPFPACTCAEPQMSHGLELLDSCQNKKPGTECKVKCKVSLKLLGNSSIRCLENSTWSTLPICSSGSCSKPRIPENIVMSEICNNKDPGDICKVACKEGGRLLGDNIIRCLNETHWSNPPLCTCPKPILNSNLKPVTECDSVLPGKECLLMCEPNTQISGPNSIICGNDSKWSVQPDCNKIFCKRPILNPTLDVDDSCSSKVPGEECTVTCKEGGQLLGNAKMKCLNSTFWTQEPECGCPPPLLDADLETTESCDSKQKSENCSVRCKAGKKLVGNPYIICQNNTRWSTQPLCRINLCAKPFLAGGILETKEDCTSKIVGETCSLRCVAGGKTIGSDNIKCLNETEWSMPPACTCPEPDFTVNVESAEDCSNKTAGTQCKVACKGFRKLIGDNFITCSEKSKWTPLPLCETLFCPRPIFPKDVLKSLTECNFKTAGETCEVSCEKGGKMIGKNIITCVNGTEWSEFPNCTCETPKLGSSLTIAEKDCSSKKRGDKCELSCKDNKKLSGVGYITCQNNTEWSPIPVCEEQYCVNTKPPTYLKAQEDCKSKVVGETCEVSCSQGGTIKGQNIIKCLSNLSWTSFPVCTCPPIDAKIDLNGNCSSVLPGAQCRVTCKSPFATAEKEYILCNNHSKWSSLSICKKTACRNMKFSSSSNYVGECENKVAGDYCYLRCKGSGKFVENSNHIRCSKNGEWSKPRKCVCSPITSLSGFDLKENCTEKTPGDTCRVACKNGLELKDRGFISCDSLYRWSSPPSCEMNYCSSPLLSRGLKIIGGNCTQLMIRTSCKLACNNKGIMNGSDTLTCDAERKLSKIPTCTCSRPILKRGVVLKQNDTCEGREIGDICFVQCQFTGDSHVIRCIMDKASMWSNLPDCPCGLPLNLNTYVTVTEHCLKQNSFSAGAECDTSCINHGNLLGETRIRCQPGGTWSRSPSCSCFNPGAERILPHLDLSKCNYTLPGGNCSVRCVKGMANKNFMHCNKNYEWDAYPTCRVTCANPTPSLFRNFVTLGPRCKTRLDFEAGTVCDLQCLNGGIYISPPAIECTSRGVWNTTSHCSCPPPEHFSVGTISRFEGDACRNKFKGDRCLYECTKPGYIMDNTSNTLKCEGNSWSGIVKCNPRGFWCEKPIKDTDERRLALGEDCAENKYYRETSKCEVKCQVATSLLTIPGRGMPLLNKTTIRCSAVGWEDLPECTCPFLQLQHPFVGKEECFWKIHNDKCLLGLQPNYAFKDRNYVECVHGSWTAMPEYRTFCGLLVHTDLLIAFPSECEKLEVNDICQVSCKNNGKFINYPYKTFPIRCEQDRDRRIWRGDVPRCACPEYPDTPGRYVKRQGEKCDQVKWDEQCLVFCILENSWSFAKCTMEGTWTLPSCVQRPVG